MKILLFLICCFYCISAFAESKKLVQKVEYIVPEGEVWVVSNSHVSACKVCTSDIHLNGNSYVGENGHLSINGKFDISFKSYDHQKIYILSGTLVWLGDSRNFVMVEVVNANDV
jgi:hypothetical protein